MKNAIHTQATSLFMAGVNAADPFNAVDAALSRAPLAPCSGRTFIVAVGKAAGGMARAALAHYPDPAGVIVVTNYENAAAIAGAQVFAAGHPVPDENGLKAANAVIALLAGTRDGDRVLVLVSGGGSALLPAPVAGVSLADKAAVNEALLGGGIEITDMNLVRQNLSRLKGGGLARLAAPARLTALILSDVVGDDLRVIASGPTVSPIGTRAEARELLKSGGLWQALPESVTRHLSSDAPVEALSVAPENRLIGSNAMSLAAMAAVAPQATVWPEPMVGDVGAAANVIAGVSGAGCWLFGGETTVRITGCGLGGRNQELALRVALLVEQFGWQGEWVFLSGGTDGRDGPTDAAGGLVDGGTLARMRAAGVDPLAALADNDSYHALKAAGDLLMTDATGTNVADLQVLIRT
ncbi:MAG: DUF4147 domain-containing protein [Marinosulfonomonas sp.]|nr:DUF4147 domain-containing protein [Marinosulfonomonas sp.]